MSTPESLQLDVNIFIAPSDLQAFWEALEPAYQAVIAEKECTQFEISVSEDKEKDEVTIHFVESWAASLEWLTTVQSRKPYYKPYLEATEKMFKRPREGKIFKRLVNKSYASETHFTKN
ncbi:hypothetical protein CYLTODRAFT_442885 [Cylindrobasidium torrendii FP15055 ss-10]|uniref:ABM domain-containing protein n=1 Tax=Cylindrobasidium torrendii FP15055 ss-10 TaxID=1314674 RepID=A0A0D7BEW6_9AGAR|nr:hypothetical protein CYLTODRAFT_442885 [Cylindrobasidium torrendii FP15055 ss-10]